MELKFTKYAAEQILERVLKEEGADDIVSGRLGVCQACSELQDWYLAVM